MEIRNPLRLLVAGILAASAISVGATPAVAATPTTSAAAVVTLAGPGLPHDPNLTSPAVHQLMGPCLCGGNFGMPSIAPWDNAACNSHFQVGDAVDVNARISSSYNAYKVGYAVWWYSSNGSCAGYQWMHFVLNMTLVHRYMGDDPSMMVDVGKWDDTLHWSQTYVGFTGGQADGNLQSRAVRVFAAHTWAALTNSCCFNPSGFLEFDQHGSYGVTVS